MINLILFLLVVFQVKHWLCDYPLQTPYMLEKFKRVGWVLPLTLHAATHALFSFVLTAITVVVVSGYALQGLYLGLLIAFLDFLIHFTVDRIKAHPNLGGRYKPDNKKFWWCLGGDQMLHHLTHYGIIYVIIQNIQSI